MAIRQIIVLLILSLGLLVGCGASEPEGSLAQIRKRDIEQLEKYDFIDLSADTIYDPSGSMNGFFRQLLTLENAAGRDTAALQLPIIHYGDSHIQAGFMTDIIRRRLGRFFGNAGRGLVAPLKLAGTNEPLDYFVTSPQAYASGKIIDRNPAVTPGTAGVAINCATANRQFTIKTVNRPEDSIDFTFSRVVVFHDSLAPMIAVSDSLLAATDGNDIFYPFMTDLELVRPTNQVDLYTYADKKFSTGALYGFSLENNHSGVLYHSMGVNGACYIHWAGADVAIQHTAALRPALIIVSLGANEAAGRNFIDQIFYDQVNSFVQRLRAANPSSAILLTAPPEAMRRGRGGFQPNPNYARVARTLQRYAKDKGVAFLNVFQIMGGDQSSKKQDNENLLQRDKLHFTPDGYTIQGLIIYNAVINGLNKYARKH